MYSVLLFASCFFFESLVRGSLTPLGSTIEIGDVPFHVPGKPVASISSSCFNQLSSQGSDDQWLPITVVNTEAVAVNADGIEGLVNPFGGQDDVWSSDFLSGVIIVGADTSASNETQAPGNITNILSSPALQSSVVPQGPYILSANGDLYQPWRLYTDFAGAFTQPTVPSLSVEGSYSALPATVPGISSPGIAVPSRLYYTKTDQKPLAGVRVGIKDIFDLAGVRTSNGNRAYYAFYPPRNESALVVQRLIDAGAIIVGKMKTSQFANGEVATSDWVDYHSAFNPRGDGYQDASSSSTGPGAGIATFPWLDLTLGSDTGGSIRGPSQTQGVFGNRPSHGLVELTNVMPLAPELDTAGFLVRDPTIWTDAAKAVYADNLTFFTAYPPKLQTFGFPTAATVPTDDLSNQTQKVLLDFLGKLEGFLQVNATALNYTAQWDTSKPNASLPALSNLLNRTYATIVAKEQTKLLRDPWFKEYAAKYDGRTPFVDPVPTVRWGYGDSLPASDLDEAINNKTIFKNWLKANVLPPANISLASCSESLILYNAPPNIVYRNTYLQPPKPPFSFQSKGQIAVFAEVPDFIIPIGSVTYKSNITNHIEELPVTVDMIVGRGCDGVIFSLVQDLVKAGILKVPQTGRTETGGKILLRRDQYGV